MPGAIPVVMPPINKKVDRIVESFALKVGRRRFGINYQSTALENMMREWVKSVSTAVSSTVLDRRCGARLFEINCSLDFYSEINRTKDRNREE
jgi:hypothetical protein